MFHKKRLLFFYLILLWVHPFSTAQIFQYNEKTETIESIRSSIDKLYNQDFAGATRGFQFIKNKFPENPAYWLAMGISLYWKMMPDQDDSEGILLFHNFMDTVIYKAKLNLQKEPNDIENLFYITAAHGFKAGKYSEENQLFLPVKQAERAYFYLKKGIFPSTRNIEFLFPSGLYNYFAVKFPEIQPLAKPLMIFFPDGDKYKGISEIKLATENALFTRAEAEVYLMRIFLRNENNPAEALHYARILTARYPRNLYFASYCSEALLYLQRFKEAQQIINKLMKDDKPYYKAIGLLQAGYLAEKGTRNLSVAKNNYLNAISASKGRRTESKRIMGLAYSGLARCAISDNQPKKAREFYKKALDYLDYDHFRIEAILFLKGT